MFSNDDDATKSKDVRVKNEVHVHYSMIRFQHITVLFCLSLPHMEMILQVYFSDSFYKLISWTFRVEFVSGLIATEPRWW